MFAHRQTALFLTVLTVSLSAARAEDWPRFRGPNGSGVSGSIGLPDEFGPATNVLWKSESGQGGSSPIVVAGRVYFTSFEGDDRIVHCLDAQSGKPLWTRTLTKVRDENASRPNGPATCTPAADAARVVAFFPDAGLVCYSVEGEERWRVDPGPFYSMHGIAGSPILAGGMVLLPVDQLKESRLLAYSAESGKLLWSVPRIDGVTGAYSTPSVFTPAGGQTQIVVSGPQELSGYWAASGRKAWSLPGLTNAPIALPLVAGNRVFVCEPVGAIQPISILASLDKDKDGKFSLEEARPNLPMFRLLERIDRETGNRDGVVEPAEWNQAFGRFVDKGGLVAVDLAGAGDATTPEVRWSYRKSVPYVASPLVCDGVLYLVQDGGIVTTVDAETGEVHKRARLSQGGQKFYASPVAADGKVLIVDTAGQLTVLRAGPQWEEKTTAALGEPCYATPAICDGCLYLRTAGLLYCFGLRR